MMQRITAAGEELEQTHQHLQRVSPKARLQHNRQLVAQIEARLAQSAKTGFAVSQLRLQGLTQQVEMLNPRATLARGYAIVRRSDGTVVLSPPSVEDNEPLLLELRDGVLPARASAERPNTDSPPRFSLGTEEL